MENRSNVLARWQELSSYSKDCPVQVNAGDSSVQGVTRGLAESGALLLELPTGEIREISSGELSLRKA
jgi:biotin-(acetyl-CoA carboxylase) ligase